MKPPPQLETRRGHCRSCGISAPRILCDACKAGEPFIQTHFLMGEDRFYSQNGTPWMTDPDEYSTSRKAEGARRRYLSKRRTKQHA